MLFFGIAKTSIYAMAIAITWEIIKFIRKEYKIELEIEVAVIILL